MYNVRIIEYPSGYQVRLYNSILDSHGIVYYDPETGEPMERPSRKRSKFPVDEWVTVDVDALEEVEASGEVLDPEASLRASMSRTKNMVYYLARSNVWEWFVTLTLNKVKVDRYDFKSLSSKVRKWFDNLKQRKAPDFYYLIVPEQHEDGAWHFHALVGGCEGLSFVDSGRINKVGQKIYNFENWKFGFSTATVVQDTARVSSYICKYITKDLCGMTKGMRRYWASGNCQRAGHRDFYLGQRAFKELKYDLCDAALFASCLDGDFLSVDYFELPAGLDVVLEDRAAWEAGEE